MSDRPLPIPYADARTPTAGSLGPRLFGGGGYSNLCVARVVVTDSTVGILPAPIPVVGTIVTNLVILLFFAAWMYLYTHSSSQSDRRVGMIAGGAIAAITVMALTGLMLGAYITSRRRGGWLMMDRIANTVSLLRERRVEPLSHLVRFEYMNLWQRDRRGRKMDGNLSELHIILKHNVGEEERICLLRSMPGVYRKLCRELAAIGGVPVLNVTEPIFGEALKISPVAEN